MAHPPPTDLPTLDTGKSRPVERWLAPFQRFARFEASGGIVLLVMAAAALIWANLPGAAGESYEHLRHAKLAFHTQPAHDPPSLWLNLSVEHWINDGLMAIFFFLVGLEIKREILVGALSTWKQAALPVFAAIGGMIVPALIYAALNAGQASTARGWGIPTATDIAFALGILSLGARGAPVGLRVFLTTLAVADDIGALLVIAIFYTETLALHYLTWSTFVLAAMFAMSAVGVRWAWPYAILSVALWLLVLQSGIHATIAGVLAAAAIPVKQRVDGRAYVVFSRAALDRFERAGPDGSAILTNPTQQALAQGIEDACEKVQTPLQRVEHRLVPWVAFAIVPLFALANAGVAVSPGDLVGTLASPECLGVILGLAIGKPLGITLAAWLAVKFRFGAVPTGVSWMQLHGAAWLGGVGFTMSLFIANLAFAKGDAAAGTHHLEHAKVGILAGSLVSAAVGLVVLRRASRLQQA